LRRADRPEAAARLFFPGTGTNLVNSRRKTTNGMWWDVVPAGTLLDSTFLLHSCKA
jgi:hypothetical protein